VKTVGYRGSRIESFGMIDLLYAPFHANPLSDLCSFERVNLFSNSSELCHIQKVFIQKYSAALGVFPLTSHGTDYTAITLCQQKERKRRGLYLQSLPPSTAMHTPVTKLASSLTKYNAAFATSSGMLILPSGTVVLNRVRSSSESGTPEKSSRRAVGARKGHMEFTRMLWGPNSAARPWVI
jgi:hypothetical protein